MKILQLVTRRQYRGAEVFAARLSEQLIAQGHKVIFAGIYAFPKPLRVEGALNLDLSGSGNAAHVPFTIWKLARLIRRERPDVVQANGSDTLKFAVFARLLAPGFPIIYRNISIISVWLGNSLFKRFIYRILFSKVNFVTSVGEESRSDFVKTLDYPIERTAVIRRGISVASVNKDQARAYVRNLFGLSDASKIVVHAGSFSKEKNHKFLVDVFSIVKEREPQAKLVLVGDGPTFDDVRKRIVTAQLDDTVFFAGFRKDVDTFLAAADLFVLCSTVEGVPGVILEAAAQLTTALAVDVGGVSEIIKDRLNGAIIKGHEPGGFADRVVRLLNDRDELMRLAENAYRDVRSKFDPRNNANEFIALYLKLANHGSKLSAK